MALFQNNFFSIAGQKERLSNAVQTIKAAVTGQGVQSNTGNKAADAVLGAAASHPFITAGVVATGISAAGYVPSATGGLVRAEGSTAVQTAVNAAKNAVTRTGASAATTGAGAVAVEAGASNAAKTALIAGAAGVAAGYILSGSGGAKADANTNQNPNFTPSQNTDGKQDTKIDQQQGPFTPENTDIQQTWNYNYGSGSINSTGTQSPAFDQMAGATANPLFSQSPSFDATQDTTADTSASSSGTNWMMIAAVAAGAYFLLNKD